MRLFLNPGLKPSEFRSLLSRCGVSNMHWREQILMEVTLLVGSAQVRAFLFGGVVGLVGTLFIQWVIISL